MISAATVPLGRTGAWRFRADWQSDYQHTRSNDDDDDSSNSTTSKKLGLEPLLHRRALPSLKAKLSLGKIISIPIFSTALTISAAASAPMIRCCRPTCAAMHRMFPAWRTAVQKSPLARWAGYFTKPVFPPGHSAFRISATPSPAHCTSVLKNRMVRCRNMTLPPHLCHSSRAGQVRYKVMMGRPEDWNHKTEGGFSPAEKRHGVADGWSLYGGALADKHYQSAAMGWGATSHSLARWRSM